MGFRQIVFVVFFWKVLTQKSVQQFISLFFEYVYKFRAQKNIQKNNLSSHSPLFFIQEKLWGARNKLKAFPTQNLTYNDSLPLWTHDSSELLPSNLRSFGGPGLGVQFDSNMSYGASFEAWGVFTPGKPIYFQPFVYMDIYKVGPYYIVINGVTL